MVITGLADRLPDRVSRLVYIDAGPLPDGMSQQDFGTQDEKAANQALVSRDGAGWQLPPPPWRSLAAGRTDVHTDAVTALEAEVVGLLDGERPCDRAVRPVTAGSASDRAGQHPHRRSV